MFRSTVTLTPPFTEDLRKITEEFSEISNDRSLFMTSAILLHNRVDNLKLSSTISRNSIPQINKSPDVYSFHWVETSSDPDEYYESGVAIFKEAAKFEAVENFVKEKFNQTVRVRIFEEYNTVCLFVDHLTVEMWHLMQSFISRYFKIFKEKQLSQVEIDFVRSLTLRSSANYIQRLQELAETDSFRTFSLRIQLDKFEKTIYERKLYSARNEVKAIEQTLDELLDRYRTTVAKHTEAKIRLEGLQVITNSTEDRTELQEYLIDNKNITKIAIHDSHIQFVVKTYLIPYLTESWEIMSSRGFIFSELQGALSNPDEAKLLLDAIFSSNHSLKLKMCAYIDLDYAGGTVRSSTSYDYSQIKGYVPNPHLQYHNCFGQNGPDIIAQLKMGDPIGAIECAINCVKHVNVDETAATFKPFLQHLAKNDQKCIVNKEGAEMTLTEAIAYLKGENNESNSAEQRDEAEVA